LALNVGVGVEAKPWTRFGVRFDLRDYLSGQPNFGLPEAPATVGAPFYPASGTINRFEVSGGVIFYINNL